MLQTENSGRDEIPQRMLDKHDDILSDQFQNVSRQYSREHCYPSPLPMTQNSSHLTATPSPSPTSPDLPGKRTQGLFALPSDLVSHSHTFQAIHFDSGLHSLPSSHAQTPISFSNICTTSQCLAHPSHPEKRLNKPLRHFETEDRDCLTSRSFSDDGATVVCNDFVRV